MATIFSHPAIALGLFPWFRDVRNSRKIIITGMVFTAIPDLDVIGLYAGIPYEHMLGHRGLSHSLLFAAIVAALVTKLYARKLEIQFWSVWVYLFACMASHGLVDALTNGGHGIAFFAPLTNERYFFTVRPIEVSTLNIRHFFEGQGIGVLISELIYLWPLCIGLFFIGWLWNNSRTNH